MPQPDQPECLEVTDDGLALLARGQEVCRFRWSEVSRIEAYKQDLFSVDSICLEFSVGDGGRVCTAHEEMAGFRELVGCLTRHFPSIAPDWLHRVAFPAFTANHGVLYERPPG